MIHKKQVENENNFESESHGHYVINGSNLHGGGGLQVATSFIADMSENHKDKCINIHLCLSQALFENLVSLNIDLKKFQSVLKIDFSIKNYFKIREYLKRFEVIFTIFGPSYFLNLGRAKHICGFAQPWICFDEYACDVDIGRFSRFLLSLKFAVQKFFFENSDVLIVESNAVKEALMVNCNFKSEIYVVSNTIAETLTDTPFLSRKGHSQVDSGPISMGYIGRAYKHKNIDILRPVLKILRDKYNLDIKVFTTLSDEEFLQTGLNRCGSIINLGPIKSGELKNYYSKIDFLILPTLLECFSISPLEAMSQSVIVFASDRPFIKESCAEHVVYFNPLNAEDIASKISKTVNNKDALTNQAMEAYKYVLSLPTNNDRTMSYLNLLDSCWLNDE